MKKILLSCVLLAAFMFKGEAQQSIKDSSIRILMLSPSLAVQAPGGDMARRFGLNGNVGVHFMYKSKTNWLLGVEGNYFFGSAVNVNGIFDSISTKDNGYIINNNGDFANVQVFESGFTAMFTVGKILPIWAINPNSGLTVKLGFGVMQHQIIFTGVGETTPQLNGDYLKGYDRLTNGYCFSQFIGYTYFGNRRLINFFAGIELYEGLTRSRRTEDYNIMRHDDTKRGDYLSGLRIGWIIPLYKKTPREYYYN